MNKETHNGKANNSLSRMEKQKTRLLAVIVQIVFIAFPFNRIFSFLHLWTDPAMIAHPGGFPGAELLNRVDAIFQICFVIPLLSVAVTGLLARKLWGAWMAITGLSIRLASALAFPAVTIILHRAGIPSAGYNNVWTFLILPMLYSIWIVSTGLLLWRSRELLE
jgi:hypothetical protein